MTVQSNPPENNTAMPWWWVRSRLIINTLFSSRCCTLVTLSEKPLNTLFSLFTLTHGYLRQVWSARFKT